MNNIFISLSPKENFGGDHIEVLGIESTDNVYCPVKSIKAYTDAALTNEITSNVNIVFDEADTSESYL